MLRTENHGQVPKMATGEGKVLWCVTAAEYQRPAGRVAVHARWYGNRNERDSLASCLCVAHLFSTRL